MPAPFSAIMMVVRAAFDLADRCSYSFRNLSQLSVLPTFGSNDGSLVP